MICEGRFSRVSRGLGLALLVMAFFVTAGATIAQAEGDEILGTLKKVRDSGVITLGIREASVPFSYLNAKGQPIGYSIDLCHAIVDEITVAIDGRTPAIKYLPVTSETRMDAVISGKVDLECGSTTNNVERQKRVAFSPVMFVSGTKLMVRKSSGIRSFRDVKGKTVVVTAGTTNEAAMRKLSEQFGLGLNIVTGRDHGESYSMVVDNKADAFATDDALLYGFIAKNNAQKDFTVVGDFLSYDPYGIMFRKDDPQLAEVVNRTFRNLAESRDLEYTYNRWFLRKLPNGDRMNLPMSAQLLQSFQILGLPE